MEQNNVNERSGSTSYILRDFEDRDFDVDDDPFDFVLQTDEDEGTAGVL